MLWCSLGAAMFVYIFKARMLVRSMRSMHDITRKRICALLEKKKKKKYTALR